MTDNLLIAETPLEQNIPASDKPENIPDKFWDAAKKEIRVDALLTSYLALEKRMSKMIALPETDEDRKRIQKIMGLPDSADLYQVNLQSDVIEIDPELNARLHAKGFTNEQVQEIYDLATEKLVPMILEMAAEFQADRELERLVKEFGGAEKWAIISGQLQEFGKKNLPKSAYEGLCCSYDGVMALYNMMKNNSGKALTRQGEASFDVLDENGLRTMMQSPKYWRDRDPAFIAKVSEGFQRLYNGK
ncbi:MAG TPA: hypothetical protein DCM27_00810 [Rhodospirillaceae bacterium]|nr:hypothetical protein [Rhodospirillaceae bacterium]